MIPLIFRYGPIFKTNLVGKDLIVSLDPDVNHYVLQQEEKSFHIWFPESFMRLLGEENIAKCYGSLHKNTRNMIRRVFGPENLRLVLLHDMQGAVEKTLCSWHDRQSVELKPALSSVCICMHESIHVDQHLLYILMAFLLGYGITQPLFIYLFICLCR